MLEYIIHEACMCEVDVIPIPLQFSYSFSLEREIRLNQVPREINHFTTGYWTINYPRQPNE